LSEQRSDIARIHEPAKPPWIRVRLAGGAGYDRIQALKNRKKLHTVCESALCPNIGECWQMGHATFMILGGGCSRNCRFCGVGHGPQPLDPEEPRHVAEAVAAMHLSHAVITSVTRDDLEDGGAGLFAETIAEIRRRCPDATVEVLIPDFKGSREALETVLAARPDILGHNVETVPRLYPMARPRANFGRSLELLKTVKAVCPEMIVKSGLMLGLGESEDEGVDAMGRIRRAGVDILTLGQYLRPGPEHLPVMHYYPPEAFAALKRRALAMGFSWVEAGPLVRSSYRAERQASALCRKKEPVSESFECQRSCQ